MKILLLIFISSICLLFGYKFYHKYKQRKQFFETLVFLCQKFDVEINFSRERIQKILINLDAKLKLNLCGLIENFLSCLEIQENLDKQKLFKNITFLTEEEQNKIFLFFKSLGRSDMENQLKEIKNYEIKFNESFAQASNDYKKYGRLSLKLSLVSTLMIIVIFL